VIYADDLVLLAKEKWCYRGLIDRLIAIGRFYVMEMNAEKTKIMRTSRKPSPKYRLC
jgi:Reverse transcriptase (RNA-dependent DNA polymerase).